MRPKRASEGVRRKQEQAAETLLALIMGQRITMTIAVATRLGIPDLLADGAKSAAVLARRTGADRAALARLMRALTTIGICRQAGRDTFDLTDVGRGLAGDNAPSLKAYALFEGEMLTGMWGGLIDTVRTGKTASEIARLGNRFDQLGRSPAELAIFNQAMASLTRLAIPGILAAYDFSRIGRMIDVGGGAGALTAAILAAYPAMRAAVFDLPRLAEVARQTLAESGVADRAEFIAGDFFKAVPKGADALVLKNIVHDWDDRQNLRLLKNCRKALTPGGKLIVIERLMPETVKATQRDRTVAFVDLQMLRGAGGAERTAAQYRRLIRESGFTRVVVRPAGIVHLIEATAG